MPTVRAICTNALTEIGAIASGETPEATDIQTALTWLQMLLDGWPTERATMAVQKQVGFNLTSGTSTVTVGPGGTVNTPFRPVWLDTVNYVNPGSSPEQEVPVGIMTPDVYAALTIKQLASALPQECFYQTTNDTVLGTLFFYPQVTQTVKIYLYFPAGIAIPTDFSDTLLMPQGYLPAMHFQLSEMLLTPFGVKDPAIVSKVETNSNRFYAQMKRQNLQPGQKGVDPALAPMAGGAYNVLSDTYSGFGGSR